MKKNVLLASLGVAALVTVGCASSKPAEKPADAPAADAPAADPAAAPADAAPADAAKPAEGSCGAEKKGEGACGGAPKN